MHMHKKAIIGSLLNARKRRKQKTAMEVQSKEATQHLEMHFF